MPRNSTNTLVRSRLDAGDRRAARFVDLQIDWVEFGTRRPVARFGGAWDAKAKAYVGDAPRSRTIEVHAQQITAVRRFDAWLTDHLSPSESTAGVQGRMRAAIARDADATAAMADDIGLAELFLSGGRRSGKTTVGMGILASYAVAVPGSIVWCVVPSDQFHVEPKEVLEAILPRPWAEYNGWPFFTFYLVNGSQIVLRSGFSAGTLKKGKAAIVALNEAQQISAASYRNARGAVVDDGGFVMPMLNPPTVGDIGTWTADAIHEIERAARPGAEHIFVDPLDNPHIDLGKLLAMKAGMTEHDWDTQIRGKILAHPDTVLYGWDASANERTPPDFGRITHEFLTAHEGERARWDHLVVGDVQSYPWIAAGVFDVYRDPRAPQDPKAGLLWMRDEVALAQGDEVDVCAELKRRGIDGERTLVVLDASCRWQQMQRDPSKQRKDFVGKGSADMFRAAGFPHVVWPDRNMKGNPDILERVRATNATVKPADGVRGLFIDPVKCPHAVESVRRWRMHRGKPSRFSRSAHFGDVIGYAVWRFFPRRGTAQKLLASEGVERPREDGFRDLERGAG